MNFPTDGWKPACFVVDNFSSVGKSEAEKLDFMLVCGELMSGL
jgi:hypothetical protein